MSSPLKAPERHLQRGALYHKNVRRKCHWQSLFVMPKRRASGRQQGRQVNPHPDTTLLAIRTRARGWVSKAGWASFHSTRSSRQFSGAVTGLLPSGGTLSPLDPSPPTDRGVGGKCLKGRREGAWDEASSNGERQERRQEGKSGPRQAQGGARRGAQGRRAGESPGG